MIIVNILDINNEMSKSKINLLSWMCFFGFIPRLFAFLRMRMSTSKQHSTNIHVSEVRCGSAIRFGQALPGYLITAHHSYASLRQLSR